MNIIEKKKKIKEIKEKFTKKVKKIDLFSQEYFFDLLITNISYLESLIFVFKQFFFQLVVAVHVEGEGKYYKFYKIKP